MSAGQIRRHACPKRLAHQMHGAIGAEELEGFLRGVTQRFLAGRAGPITVARILQDEDVERRGLLQCLRVIGAVQGVASLSTTGCASSVLRDISLS